MQFRPMSVCTYIGLTTNDKPNQTKNQRTFVLFFWPHGMHFYFYTQGEVVTHNTHAIISVSRWNLASAFPILASSPRDSQEQWAASNAAPGTKSKCQSCRGLWTVEHLLLLHVFGVLWGEPG